MALQKPPLSSWDPEEVGDALTLMRGKTKQSKIDNIRENDKEGILKVQKKNLAKTIEVNFPKLWNVAKVCSILRNVY